MPATRTRAPQRQQSSPKSPSAGKSASAKAPTQGPISRSPKKAGKTALAKAKASAAKAAAKPRAKKADTIPKATGRPARGAAATSGSKDSMAGAAATSNVSGVSRKASTASLSSAADSRAAPPKKVQKVGLLQGKKPDEVSAVELAAIVAKAKSVDDLFGPDTGTAVKKNLCFEWFGDNREKKEWEYIHIPWEIEVDGVMMPTMVPSIYNREIQIQTLNEYVDRMGSEGYCDGAAGARIISCIEVIVSVVIAAVVLLS